MCFLIPPTHRMCRTWEVDEHLRTNTSYIFADGDVVDRETESQMARPVGSHDGGIVAQNALSKEKPRVVDRRVIPLSDCPPFASSKARRIICSRLWLPLGFPGREHEAATLWLISEAHHAIPSHPLSCCNG
jgi:hypothetical protein